MVPKKWITKVVDGTPEWHAARRNHIGASEIGIILGFSEYRPTVTELYHIKVGTHVPPDILNEPMFHGRHQEKYVTWLWQHYERPGDGYIHNADSDTVIRTCRNIHGMIVNPKYPYLACNLDRVAEKDSFMLNENGVLTDITYPGNFPMEAKTINGFAAKKWESGIPQSYIAQVHQQMLITGETYSEIAIFIDGRKFEVHPVRFDKWLGREIIDKGHDFWNMVKAGRDYYKVYLEALTLGEKNMAEDAMAKIYEFEPEPNAADAYKEYLSERMKVEVPAMLADDSIERDAKLHRQIQDLKKSLEDIESEIGNRLRYACVRNNVERINMQDGTYIRFYERAGSSNRVLDNRLKKMDGLRTKLLKESILRENLKELASEIPS